MNTIKLFVSHSSEDEVLAKAFVDCLEGCLVVPGNTIRCTSVVGYKLDPGDDSADVLRENLEYCSMVIGLLTEKSLKSGYVVMELGAAWGLRKITSAVLAPGVDYSRIPGPLRQRHAAKAANSEDVASLMAAISKNVALPTKDPVRFMSAVNTFAKVAQAYP